VVFLSKIFIVKPHKSLDQIQKEYGVKFSKKLLNLLAELVAKSMKYENGVRYVCMGCLAVAEKLGVSEDKIEDFAKDLAKTIIFYYRSVKIIGEIIKFEQTEMKKDDSKN